MAPLACGMRMMTAAREGLKTDQRFWDFKRYLNPRCTPEHPCTHSEGHCTTDSDCERNGYHICGPDCIGLEPNACITFPSPGPAFNTRHYPNNTDIKYSSSDKCCVRRWGLSPFLICDIIHFLFYRGALSQANKDEKGCLGPKECKYVH